jgi:hypothetical protein
MSTEDIKHKREVLEALEKRLHVRELQAAKLGVNADPIIVLEMEDLKKQIAVLTQEVGNESTILDLNKSTIKRGCAISINIAFIFIGVIFGYLFVGPPITLDPSPPNDPTGRYVVLSIAVVVILYSVFTLIRLLRNRFPRQ